MKSTTVLFRRWRRLLLAPISLLAAVTLVIWMALPSAAATVVNTEFPFVGFVFNPCNGEQAYFNGTGHLVVAETEDSNGGFHQVRHMNIHVAAIGNQGNTYQVNEEENYAGNFKAGQEWTFTVSLNEISGGSAPNWVARVILHVTVKPDGTVTAFMNEDTFECRG